MKIVNLPITAHENRPNVTLVRAIIQIDAQLESEIYDVAAKNRSGGLSYEQHHAGKEITFVDISGHFPPRPVTNIVRIVSENVVQWKGTYQHLMLGGYHQVMVETEPLTLDQLKSILDEDEAAKVDVIFVSVWSEGSVRTSATLNPVNGAVYLKEKLNIPTAYETLVEEVIEFTGDLRLSVSKLPSMSDDVYFISPEEMLVHEALLNRLEAARILSPSNE